MRELLLHIGQGKTGTSYVQSCLANSYGALQELGLDYYRGDTGPAMNWQISSGNGVALVNAEIESFQFTTDRILFSFEALFGHFAQNRDFITKMQAFCRYHDISRVRMLMLIRHPVLHAESCYQQDVKRAGAAYDVDTGFARYQMPLFSQRLLETDLGLPDTTIEVLNYDRHRGDLRGVMARFLGVSETVLTGSPDARVNRSLSAAELELQRRVNAHLGKPFAPLSNALINELPHIPSDRCLPSRVVQQQMLDRLRPVMEAVNARIDPAEHYVIAPIDPVVPDMTLGAEQLDVIAKVFAAQMK